MIEVRLVDGKDMVVFHPEDDVEANIPDEMLSDFLPSEQGYDGGQYGASSQAQGFKLNLEATGPGSHDMLRELFSHGIPTDDRQPRSITYVQQADELDPEYYPPTAEFPAISFDPDHVTTQPTNVIDVAKALEQKKKRDKERADLEKYLKEYRKRRSKKLIVVGATAAFALLMIAPTAAAADSGTSNGKMCAVNGLSGGWADPLCDQGLFVSHFLLGINPWPGDVPVPEKKK